jgi:hypothetical protein
MRGSVRQFVPLLLAATYAVLWTCGSAWHLANCTHCDHSDGGSARVETDSHCCRSHSGSKSCSHSVGSSSVDSDASAPSDENGSPETPHDASNCEICHLFAQTLTVVSVVSVEVSPEWVENSACLIPLTVPECELIPAISRGPPVIA